jgi:hypothetical protein
MNDVWKRVFAEVSRKPDGHGREVAWLSERLQMKIQRVNNWAVRGVPSNAFPALAQALGWSLDDIAGTSTPDGRPPWPFPLVDRSRWDACTPEMRGYVQAAINRALDEVLAAAEDARDAPGNYQQAAREVLRPPMERPSRPKTHKDMGLFLGSVAPAKSTKQVKSAQARGKKNVGNSDN